MNRAKNNKWNERDKQGIRGKQSVPIVLSHLIPNHLRFLYVTLFSLSLLLGPLGCATIMKYEEEHIYIDSDPPGVKVDLEEYTCHTPCTLELPRGRNLQAVLTRPGFRSQTHHINGHSLDGWLWGNLAYLFFFPVAIGVDFYTGYAYDYGPDRLHVKMEPVKQKLKRKK